jgi:hypothetical protein
MSNQLKVLIKPCDGGTCPALYEDEQGRVFVQGSKLGAMSRGGIAIANHEEVVEITPDLLNFLRTQ